MKATRGRSGAAQSNPGYRERHAWLRENGWVQYLPGPKELLVVERGERRSHKSQNHGWPTMHPAHLVRYLGRTRQIAVLPDRRDRIGMAEIISARAISDTEVTCVQGTGCESTNSAGETLALQSLDALVHDLRQSARHTRGCSGGATPAG
ncbi:hypothetical protein LTR01_006190 [Friedmanniomyces endolithicus]|nr:hypothetical protein LTS09_012697 [Friedmanniomyces endolithicus]KAK0306332.1 hypothetical protein LTR01_006190 [Friedmanniomyces endolithicus]